ncbi:MAG: zinc-ribbon domain-containing protein [Phycisphaerae bacterium]|nr:zinc-ribbon domain-containing protein [Phycisphaerae bacterium]
MKHAEFDEDWIDDEDGDEPAEMICPSCGREVLEDTQKCPHCGDWIVPVDRSGGTSRFIWAIVVVFLVLALIAFVVR